MEKNTRNCLERYYEDNNVKNAGINSVLTVFLILDISNEVNSHIFFLGSSANPERRLIFQSLRNSNFKDIFVKRVESTIKYFREVLADAFMCRLLKLEHMEYRNLIINYFKRTYGRNIFDDDKDMYAKQKGTAHSYIGNDPLASICGDPLTTVYARALTIMAKCTYPDSGGSMLSSISQDFPETDAVLYIKLEKRKEKAIEFNQFIRSTHLGEYLKVQIEFWGEFLLNAGNCTELVNLRNAYRKLRSAGTENSIKRQVESIDNYWIMCRKYENVNLLFRVLKIILNNVYLHCIFQMQ